VRFVGSVWGGYPSIPPELAMSLAFYAPNLPKKWNRKDKFFHNIKIG
jgi:hypothetical protein